MPNRFPASFSYGVAGEMPEIVFQPTPLLSLSGFSFQGLHDPALAVGTSSAAAAAAAPAPAPPPSPPAAVPPPPAPSQQNVASQPRQSQQLHEHNLASQPGSAFPIFTTSPIFSPTAAYSSSAGAAAALTSLPFPSGVPHQAEQPYQGQPRTGPAAARLDSIVKTEMGDREDDGAAQAAAIPENDIEAQELAARDYQPVLEVSWHVSCVV